jgi:hypothetical protein
VPVGSQLTLRTVSSDKSETREISTFSTSSPRAPAQSKKASLLCAAQLQGLTLQRPSVCKGQRRTLTPVEADVSMSEV